jgi:transposase
MKKSYVFRIYPSKNQEARLNRTLSTCRHLYNEALAERRRQAELNNLQRNFDVFPWGKPEWISYEDQANALPGNKTNSQEEVHAQVLQNVLKRLDRSFQNLYNGFGYPRFKGRNRYNTFTYPQSGFEINDMDLILSKIGSVRIFQHREMEGKIKTCTIKSLAKSILDAGWGQIIRFTAYKAAYAGKTVELVDPYWTSQTCLCGAKVPKSLKVRTHVCPECGLILNRDHVSAILIERRGKQYVPTDCGELTPVESMQISNSWKQEAPLL